MVKLPRRLPVHGAPPAPSLAERHPAWFELGVVQVGAGWRELVDALFDDLAAGLSADDRARLKIAALRERDGRLQIETYEDVPAARVLIDRAIAAAATICQHCGAPGKRRRFTGWTATLCPDCRRRLGGIRIGG